MTTIKVRGHSDDIICVEGDTCEEFYPDTDRPAFIACSDGTVLGIEYTRGGLWRINRLAEGTASYSKVEAIDDDGDGDYSDRVTLEGDIRWLVFGSGFERIKVRGTS